MTKLTISLAALLALTCPALAQDAPDAPSPGQIVAEAAGEEWVEISGDDLLVMTLAPDDDGTERTVVIQLMPAPFSQGWVENIRTLARAEWYDGITVNRVQDNYVVQWGDPNYDNPEADGAAKPLPEGLQTVVESDYVTKLDAAGIEAVRRYFSNAAAPRQAVDSVAIWRADPYARAHAFVAGWPIATLDMAPEAWPVHCYGMVGVGRGMSPDTGSGAELYTVIGHAPRHLDRNIALVGRIVEGMEHLSSLPRGSGALGFYTAEEAGKRTPVLSIRVASDLPAGRPAFEYLSTEGEAFARYAKARANRRDPFFIVPAGGADICNIPVPVRRVAD
ncbi:peptidylprolyl isomerase [Tritonibacter scottomollicae]|uniref:peptidylprolyl isomerase n=1 Tax=Tritonibacter scottomollicae TaxID=483013 RepID=UPI003AA9520A